MSYWNEKIVAITGGSAGFGLALANEFSHRGAIVVVLGRVIEKSETAVAAIESAGGRAFPVRMDATDETEIESAVAQIVNKFGRIDAWVNNVGKSTRIEFGEASPDVYREFLEVNLMSAVKCTAAVLPALEQQRGHLINIGSLSSKVAWPFVAPYTVSKHALAGYTNQVRLEAAPNTHVLLVCPGPMSRADSGSRYAETATSIPDSAKQPGGGAPVKLLDPAYVAKRVLRACEQRKPELVIPGKIRLLAALLQLFPSLGNRLLKKKAGK